MKRFRVPESEKRFTQEQKEILHRLGFILNIVESAEKKAIFLPIDWQPKHDRFLEKVQGAVVDVENGMSKLPPGLTVEDLTQEVQQLIHCLPGK